jgi:hypothetical protein
MLDQKLVSTLMGPEKFSEIYAYYSFRNLVEQKNKDYILKMLI